MSRCTAPVNGHRTASGRANCPACRDRCGYGYRSFGSHYRLNGSGYGLASRSSGNSGGRGGARNRKPHWSRPSSTVYYTVAEIRALMPIRESVEKRAINPDLRNVFLCHSWDDRNGAARELHNLLDENGVSVWFSEKDVPLGSSLLREIDKGLANSRVGIVLVTPSFIRRIENEGIAEKELSALLARDLLVPIVHNTTFEQLREVSPLLGSRSGLDTNEESMLQVALKITELVNIVD